MADVDAPSFWTKAYREGRDGWDMGTPAPVFADLLRRLGLDFTALGGEDFGALPAPPRVLVPGCGRGYDALLFAGHGCEVTAVDFAPEPLALLREDRDRLGLAVDVLEQDMFAMAGTHAGAFDLLVEYTCVCAIDPQRRKEFARFASAVLRPGGAVLALLFPVDGRPGGPPFSIDPGEFKTLMERGFVLRHESTPETSVKPRLGKELLLLWTRKEE